MLPNNRIDRNTGGEGEGAEGLRDTRRDWETNFVIRRNGQERAETHRNPYRSAKKSTVTGMGWVREGFRNW